MKVNLNLSIPTRPRERYALVWAVPLTLVALAGLLYFAYTAVGSLREYGKVHRSLRPLQDQEARLREREANLKKDLARPQFAQLFRQAEFVNTVLDRKQLSMTELTAKVTKLLPAQVRLTGLALSQAEGEPVVRLTILGGSEEAAESFLSNLEDSPDFKDVAITNQGVEPGASAGGAVIIACTASYVGGSSAPKSR